MLLWIVLLVPDVGLCRFSHVFLDTRSFVVSCYTFRFMTHFELIIEHDARYGLEVFLLFCPQFCFAYGYPLV